MLADEAIAGDAEIAHMRSALAGAVARSSHEIGELTLFVQTCLASKHIRWKPHADHQPAAGCIA
jgi:hypothetical protein